MSSRTTGTDADAAPEANARRRRLRTVRTALLLAALVLPLARGWQRARARAPEVPPPPALRVDLASAPAWRLALLPGVGPRRAAEIVRDRDRHGPLPSLDALVRVPTIGRGIVARLRAARVARVLVGGRPVGCGDGSAPAPRRRAR